MQFSPLPLILFEHVPVGEIQINLGRGKPFVAENLFESCKRTASCSPRQLTIYDGKHAVGTTMLVRESDDTSVVTTVC